MLDPEFVKYLASLGVGGVIALFIYYISRQDNKAYTESLKTIAEERKGQVEMLVGVIKEVTSSVASNTRVIEAFHQRLDRLYKYEGTLKDIKDQQQIIKEGM